MHTSPVAAGQIRRIEKPALEIATDAVHDAGAKIAPALRFTRQRQQSVVLPLLGLHRLAASFAQQQGQSHQATHRDDVRDDTKRKPMSLH